MFKKILLILVLKTNNFHYLCTKLHGRVCWSSVFLTNRCQNQCLAHTVYIDSKAIPLVLRQEKYNEKSHHHNRSRIEQECTKLKVA